ncbi:hypothetical protein V493_00166 [Pseudogymnoascus sp. VKM F-4281 (FW-2241)]|nr:hypothetical protein V493_00166 [Pseudogymnoascus sp. VKM F-4281 (FW-2241)]
MDESRNHYDGYYLNTMQADQHTGQSLPSTFNPAEHLWFANSENAVDSTPIEEKQQRIYLSPSEESQIDNESLSFPSTRTLLPSPADLDFNTSPTCFLETMYQVSLLSQRLGALDQKFEGVEKETVRVTRNHEKFLTWTLGVNKALVSIGETLLKLDAEVKKLGAQKAETRSLVTEMQEE